MAKKNNKDFALEVLDAESGKFIEISHEQVRLAQYVHQQALLGVFISAVSIKKMIDERLYFALGFGSRDEYIDAALPYGRSQAYKLIAIATKFDSVAKSLTGKDLGVIGEGEGPEKVQSTGLNENEQKITQLGVEKLYELTRLDDENVKELIKTGHTRAKDADFDLDKILSASARQLQEQIKKYRDKHAQDTEKIKTLRAEKDLIESERDKLAEENKTARELEIKFGPAASKLKHKRDVLEEARRLLSEFIEVANRAGVEPGDSQGLKKDLVDLIRRVDDTHKNLIAFYDDVISEF